MDLNNLAKLAMLHRLSGGGPITVYQSENPFSVRKLYDYLQELCNHSAELELTQKSIVCRNTFLAYHLLEAVRQQKIVKTGDEVHPTPETAVHSWPDSGTILI